MSAPAQVSVQHTIACWRYHDACALERAEIALRLRPGVLTVEERDLLDLIRGAIQNHPHGVCPDATPCPAIGMARAFLVGGS